MEITLVKVFPVQEDKLKAFVSVVFDSCFMVNDIKVIQGKDGLFLSMPSRRKKSGEFKDVAHPLNNSTRRMLEERVLEEYRSVVEDATPRRPDREGQPTDAPVDKVVRPQPAFKPPAAPTSQVEVPVAAIAATAPSTVASSQASAEGLHAVSEPGLPESEESASVPTTADKTLEEVQEIHLSDSFWSVS